jgi:hypothetical protein
MVGLLWLKAGKVANEGIFLVQLAVFDRLASGGLCGVENRKIAIFFQVCYIVALVRVITDLVGYAERVQLGAGTSSQPWPGSVIKRYVMISLSRLGDTGVHRMG